MSDLPTLYQGGDDQRQAREQSLRGRQPPTQVPGYRLERFLGSGAYGEVWLAVDRNTQRQVAVKFYSHRGGVDWSLLSREVEKLSFMFADRRVVQLLEVGWEADPPYYVMEYLEHGSLEDRLRDGSLGPGEALELFRELAEGLVQAHAKGLLHCDLKPANILFGADGKPRLADFGQSRLSHEQVPALGTLFYMAPEQADLRSLPHARWDVYALGAVVYRLLAGEPPYRTAPAIAELEGEPDLDRRLERYRRLLAKAPRPRGHRQVAGVDAALAEIIDRCLEPNPERRFANAQAVLGALDERRVRRARRPLLVLGALGPLLLLGVMSFFAYAGFQRAIAESRAAVLSRVAESNRFAAEFVAEAVARKIDKRWEILREAAADPDLRRLLSGSPPGTALDDPARRELQARVEALHTRLDPARQNWFLTAPSGVQWVRIPEDAKSIGQNFSYRDYFHGQGRDLPPDTAGLGPIEQPHLSIVFQGKASRQQLVAFSVPIWSETTAGESPTVLGVLCMSVPLGSFAELHGEGSARGAQRAVLVDLRPDEDNQAGAILEHPGYDPGRDPGDGGQPPRRVHLNPAELPRLAETSRLAHEVVELRDAWERSRRVVGPAAVAAEVAQTEAQLRERARQLAAVDFSVDHHDPFAEADDQAWLVAARPVLTGDGSTGYAPVGWMVLVEEPYARAVEPVRQLAELLVRRGLWALGVVLVVLTGLWAFVVALLNEGPRRGWLARLRTRAGLAPSGASLATGSGSLAPKSSTPRVGGEPQPGSREG